ncbi:MAG: PaaI family thioesterase [Hymenobacteraceae bacterium]|nr:PaaI family thioesterase [Hymenobacteraceae bacterium]MDX5397369.1 PaaI family thioesterase [Hymenobacteraceae bacterium]MDX5443874.1 PaaI family thioesterase [Hymenobacteraceae bacterium]MDX5513449.1 PaaI family thioesterase [Hymenobacteraceae bacterium]
MSANIKTFNPEYKETIREKLNRQFFMHLMGFEVTVIEEGRVEGILKLDERHKQHKGFVHGGVVATLADIVAGFAAVSLVPKGHHVVTAEIKVSYFHPGLGDSLYAKGWVLKQGRKLNFCEAEVYRQEEGQEPLLIAKASATMANIAPEELKR